MYLPIRRDAKDSTRRIVTGVLRPDEESSTRANAAATPIQRKNAARGFEIGDGYRATRTGGACEGFTGKWWAV